MGTAALLSWAGWPTSSSSKGTVSVTFAGGMCSDWAAKR